MNMTLAQFRAQHAWACTRGGYGWLRDPAYWLEARGMPPRWSELTGAQARLASRELNAWRAGDEGWVRPADFRRYPRKERRNAARMARLRAAA